jgi:structure-specific endonuclease subunit SLX1
MERKLQPYRFYGCYLLVSENPEAPAGKSYIGFTVDPARRIRQHNGDLTTGGARRTKSMRPWRMVCIVHGFKSQVQGLQFEWAWQHPLMCRAVRSTVMSANIPGCKMTARGRQREMRLESNILVICAMLRSPPWDMMPLTVTFFDPILFQQCHTLFPSTHRIDTSLSPDALSATKVTLDSPESLSSCFICKLSLLSPHHSRVVSCPGCFSTFHVLCVYKFFNTTAIFPDQPGECMGCGVKYSWAEFVASAVKVVDARNIKPESSESEGTSDSSSEEENVVPNAGCSLRDRLFQKTNIRAAFHI